MKDFWTTPELNEVTPQDYSTLIAYCSTFGSKKMKAAAIAGAFAIQETLHS